MGHPTVRFIRYKQLHSRGIPFSRVHIGRLERAGRFPRRVRLGLNTVAWREDEVEAWCKARSNERFARAPSSNQAGKA